jgi:hypothetical protein
VIDSSLPDARPASRPKDFAVRVAGRRFMAGHGRCLICGAGPASGCGPRPSSRIRRNRDQAGERLARARRLVPPSSPPGWADVRRRSRHWPWWGRPTVASPPTPRGRRTCWNRSPTWLTRIG